MRAVCHCSTCEARAFAGDWDEDKHPRGHGGKFAPGGGKDKDSEEALNKEGYIGVNLHPNETGRGYDVGTPEPEKEGYVAVGVPGMSKEDFDKYSGMKAGGIGYTGGPTFQQKMDAAMKGEPQPGVSQHQTQTYKDGDTVWKGEKGEVQVYKMDSEIADAHRLITPNLAPVQSYLGLAAKRSDGEYVKSDYRGPNMETTPRPALFPSLGAAKAALDAPKGTLYPRLAHPGDDPANVARTVTGHRIVAAERARKMNNAVCMCPNCVAFAMASITVAKFASTPVTVSKRHPINPNKIKPPKGKAPAPGKSIGAIHASPAAAAAPAAAPAAMSDRKRGRRRR